jgi:hypothetical protein
MVIDEGLAASMEAALLPTGNAGNGIPVGRSTSGATPSVRAVRVNAVLVPPVTTLPE